MKPLKITLSFISILFGLGMGFWGASSGVTANFSDFANGIYYTFILINISNLIILLSNNN